MKQKQRIALLGTMVLTLIFSSCGRDNGNNSSESEGNSSSSVVKSSSSSVGGSSSSPVVSSSSAKVQSSSSVPLSSSVGALSSSSFIEYGSLTYEGQTYKTVVIGTQTWMAENLNYAVDSSWCYNNRADSCAKYGRLYQWASAMNIDTAYNHINWGGSDLNHQGICPDGWHLPNNQEWQILYDYVKDNSDDGVGLRLASVNGWTNDSDLFGFSALPAGFRGNGDFGDAGNYANFWSAAEYYGAGCWYLSDDGGGFISGNKSSGFSVRCLKDAE